MEAGSVTAMSDNLFAWDFADDFTGLEAASLIVGFTPSVDAESNPAIAPLLAAMRDAHLCATLSVMVKGMGTAHDDNFRLLESVDFDAHRRWLATPLENRRALDKFLRRIVGLPAQDVKHEKHEKHDGRPERLFALRLREAAGGKAPTEGEIAVASREDESGSPKEEQETHNFNGVDFDLARFARSELHRWITANSYWQKATLQ